jgi:hypothetical protein
MKHKNISFQCCDCGLNGKELEKSGYCLERITIIKGNIKRLKFKCFKCLLGLNSLRVNN